MRNYNKHKNSHIVNQYANSSEKKKIKLTFKNKKIECYVVIMKVFFMT